MADPLPGVIAIPLLQPLLPRLVGSSTFYGLPLRTPVLTGMEKVVVEKAEWYRSLLADLRELVDNEKATLLRIKHQMGRRILKAKKGLVETGGVRDERGWTGMLGELMNHLSMDLGYSQSELYDALKLVEKFPQWNDFAEKEFVVGEEKGGDSGAVRISGKEMTWDAVRREVLYPSPRGPPPIQSVRAKTACVFKSEDCGGDTRKVEICGHHFGDFVVWMNTRKLKMQEAEQR